MSKWAKTDEFQTKLTQLLIAENIGVKGNLTKLYINILNTPPQAYDNSKCRGFIMGLQREQ